MTSYVKHFTALFTPQRQKARPDQVVNSAGGYAFVLDLWARLDRWLVLGVRGGYVLRVGAGDDARERAHHPASAWRPTARGPSRGSPRSASPAARPRTIRRSSPWRWPPATRDLATRRAALAALPRGVPHRHAISSTSSATWRASASGAAASAARSRAWYNDKPAERLAYQAIKYQRARRLESPRSPAALAPDGADARARRALPLDHRRPRGARAGVARGKAHLGGPAAGAGASVRGAPRRRPTGSRSWRSIREHRFTHEMLLSEWKNDPDVWEALLEDMPQTALLRNLGKMTAVGLLSPMQRGDPQGRGAAHRRGAPRAGARPPDRSPLGPQGLRAGPR